MIHLPSDHCDGCCPIMTTGHHPTTKGECNTNERMVFNHLFHINESGLSNTFCTQRQELKIRTFVFTTSSNIKPPTRAPRCRRHLSPRDIYYTFEMIQRHSREHQRKDKHPPFYSQHDNIPDTHTHTHTPTRAFLAHT